MTLANKVKKHFSLDVCLHLRPIQCLSASWKINISLLNLLVVLELESVCIHL